MLGGQDFMGSKEGEEKPAIRASQFVLFIAGNSWCRFSNQKHSNQSHRDHMMQKILKTDVSIMCICSAISDKI